MKTMQDTRNTGEGGFSLVEVLIGALLVVAFLGALFTLVNRQGVQRRINFETSLAIGAALSNLEGLRATAHSALPAQHGLGFPVPGMNGEAEGLQVVPGDPDGLPGEFSVVEDPASTGVKLYRVSATVVWRGVTGDRQIRLETLVGERK